MTKGIFLLLGSNLGDKMMNLNNALKEIKNKVGTIEKYSLVYETAPWGNSQQPSFLNQCVEISSTLFPEELLVEINLIEKQLGRARKEKWGERTIDIDILFYNNLVVNQPRLSIPHPAIPTRRFTLVPLCEIADHFLHPVLKMTNGQLLEQCDDPLEVKLLNTPDL